MKQSFQLIFLLTISSLQIANAQYDLSSLMLTDSWQAMNANPALQTPGLTINLPGVYNNLWITNVTYSDLVVEQNGQTVLDISNAIDQLEDRNFLREDLDIETIGVGFTIGKLGLSLGHRIRLNSILDYPKTLPQLIWEGNAQFIGQSVDFAPIIDLTVYHELALGASFQVTDNIQVGGRIKYLGGGASINTERSQLTLNTSDDIYQLSMDADFV
ncbi:MAG: DUF5723 family protein, partial [Bacteroidota bacterium]